MDKQCPFEVGQVVTLVNRSAQKGVELVRITEITAEDIAVSGYTTRFDLQGRGLPKQHGSYMHKAAVLSLTGELLQPESRNEWVAEKTIPAYHDIREASAEELNSLSRTTQATPELGMASIPVYTPEQVARLTKMGLL